MIFNIVLMSLILSIVANHKLGKATDNAFQELIDEGVEAIHWDEFLNRFPEITIWTVIKQSCVLIQVIGVLWILASIIAVS